MAESTVPPFAEDQYIGEIRLMASERLPLGWLPCDGQLLDIDNYMPLFRKIRTAFGGDGETNFALPDLRGRVVVGTSDTDADYAYATPGGAMTVTLTEAEMPSHGHGWRVNSANATETVPGGVLAPASFRNGKVSFYVKPNGQSLVPLSAIGTAGGGFPHENRQPFLRLCYCIAFMGQSISSQGAGA